MFFTVKESDNILGQVVIPANSLSAISDLIMTTPLQKHKKGPTPQGELVYKCVCTTSTGEQCVTRDAHTQTENVTLSSRSSCSVVSSTFPCHQLKTCTVSKNFEFLYYLKNKSHNE